MLLTYYMYMYALTDIDQTLRSFCLPFHQCVSGAGLVKKKGFKGSFAEAGSYAKV